MYGYGRMEVQGKLWKAHRVSWMVHNNSNIPNELYVCHRCDTPACVKPEHLFLGTPADNMADKVSKGRSWRGGKGKPLAFDLVQVEALRKLVLQGFSSAEIAKKFSKHEETVRRYCIKYGIETHAKRTKKGRTP